MMTGVVWFLSASENPKRFLRSSAYSGSLRLQFDEQRDRSGDCDTTTTNCTADNQVR